MKQTKLRWAAGSRRSQAKTPRLPKSFLYGNRSQGGLKSTKGNLKIVVVGLGIDDDTWEEAFNHLEGRQELWSQNDNCRWGKQTSKNVRASKPSDVHTPSCPHRQKNISGKDLGSATYAKTVIPSPRMIMCLCRIDLTRCPADEICKRFLILWSLTPSRTDVFILSALSKGPVTFRAQRQILKSKPIE